MSLTVAAALSAADVASQIGVSASTVRQWAKAGKLKAERVTDGLRGWWRFDPEGVEQFRATYQKKPFARYSTAEVDNIITQARERGRVEPGLTWVCRQLAIELKRPERGIEKQIRKFEKAHPGDVVVPRIPRGKRRPKAIERYPEGGLFACLEAVEIAEIKQGVVTAPAAPEVAPAEVISLPAPLPCPALALSYIPSPEFAAADADPAKAAAILGPMPALEDFEAKRRNAVVPENAPPEMAHLYLWPLLTREQEAHLFRQMNYLKHKGNADAARSVRDVLISCNQRLVYAQAKRRLALGESIDDLVSDGNISLLKAVEKFDYSRGNKFSTYATWALMKNFARSIQEEQKRQQRFPTGHDEIFEGWPDGRCGDEAERLDEIRETKASLERLLSTLDPRTREVVMLKHGIGCDELKVEEIGRELGLTKERVRQIANRGMKLLREHAAKKAAGCVLCDAAHEEVVERPG